MEIEVVSWLALSVSSAALCLSIYNWLDHRDTNASVRKCFERAFNYITDLQMKRILDNDDRK